jgi:hypothetical protein
MHANAKGRNDVSISKKKKIQWRGRSSIFSTALAVPVVASVQGNIFMA